MPLEELFVHGHILQTHYAVGRIHLHNTVHQEEWIAVRKELHDFCNIVHNAILCVSAGYRITHLSPSNSCVARQVRQGSTLQMTIATLPEEPQGPAAIIVQTPNPSNPSG